MLALRRKFVIQRRIKKNKVPIRVSGGNITGT